MNVSAGLTYELLLNAPVNVSSIIPSDGRGTLNGSLMYYSAVFPGKKREYQGTLLVSDDASPALKFESNPLPF